jgi:serine/threonine protein kinase
LLATYEQQGSKYLLFPWADSDLLRYWSLENNDPSMDLETVRWVAQQCAGICDGVSMIHRDVKKPLKDRFGDTLPLYGRHGDIKPRNTLWFRDSGENRGKGTLKITDFGIAEVNSKTSRSKKTNGHIDFSPTYCPPEVRMPGGEISRSFDIWTLGCLYLEFATWLLGGWPLVKKFQRLRRMKDAAHPNAHLDTFFEIVKDSRTGVLAARVKPEVTSVSLPLRVGHPSSEWQVLPIALDS